MPDAPGAVRTDRDVKDMEARRFVLSRMARDVALVPRIELEVGVSYEVESSGMRLGT
jgi:hypothetical protein